MDKIKKGRVYDIEHSRKGPLTVQAVEDEPKSKDEFMDMKIIEGRARYASIGNNLAQKLSGLGTPGDTITVRRSLFRVVRRREDLEKGK